MARKLAFETVLFGQFFLFHHFYNMQSNVTLNKPSSVFHVFSLSGVLETDLCCCEGFYIGG